MTNYNTYIYLDPRKPGKYIYNKISFDYQPFYVGKGRIQGNYDRCNDHLKEAEGTKNSYKLNIIRKIIKDDLTPIIVKLLNNVTEEEAFTKEIELIEWIGRHDLGTGPLTNKTAGGEGASGCIKSKETCEAISKGVKGVKKKEGHGENVSKGLGIFYTTKEGALLNQVKSDKATIQRITEGDTNNPLVEFICDICGETDKLRIKTIVSRFSKYDSLFVCQTKSSCHLEIKRNRKVAGLEIYNCGICSKDVKMPTKNREKRFKKFGLDICSIRNSCGHKVAELKRKGIL